MAGSVRRIKTNRYAGATRKKSNRWRGPEQEISRGKFCGRDSTHACLSKIYDAAFFRFSIYSVDRSCSIYISSRGEPVCNPLPALLRFLFFRSPNCSTWKLFDHQFVCTAVAPNRRRVFVFAAISVLVHFYTNNGRFSSGRTALGFRNF